MEIQIAIQSVTKMLNKTLLIFIAYNIHLRLLIIYIAYNIHLKKNLLYIMQLMIMMIMSPTEILIASVILKFIRN